MKRNLGKTIVLMKDSCSDAINIESFTNRFKNIEIITKSGESSLLSSAKTCLIGGNDIEKVIVIFDDRKYTPRGTREKIDFINGYLSNQAQVIKLTDIK